MQINPIFDNSVGAAPLGFRACVNAVCQFYDALFTNDVTVTILVGYGTIGGVAMPSNAAGESATSYYLSFYSKVVAALNAENAPGASALPPQAPQIGLLAVSQAQSIALGLGGGIGLDGEVGFANTLPFVFQPSQSGPVPAGSYDFTGVVEHEISEVLGRTSYISLGHTGIADLYRYQAAAVPQTGNGGPSYFSLDGGVTALRAWNNLGQIDGDLGDWSPSSTPDAYDVQVSPGHIDPVTAVDKQLMAALGWSEASNAAALTVAGAVPVLTAPAAIAEIEAHAAAFVTVADKAASLSLLADTLQLLATNGNIAAIEPTDARPISLSGVQLVQDSAFLGLIEAPYQLAVTTAGGMVTEDVIASAASPGDLPSMSQIAALFAAILGRAPDPLALSYYQGIATGAAPPALTVYADWFIQSPEYAGDPRHAYAADQAGDTDFILDSYAGLLQRTPSPAEIAYYLGLIGLMTQGGATRLQSHADILLDFSQSPEFIADITVAGHAMPDLRHWLDLI